MHIHRISFNRALISIFYLFFSCLSCKSTPSSSPKVLGGDITTDYPYVIKIVAKDYSVEDFQVPDDEDPICGSVAVSPTTLITASHCITDPSAEYDESQKPISIRYYKKIEIQVNGKKYTTNKLKWHPRYEKVVIENQNNSMYHLKRPFDIAVIVFDDAPFKDIPLASISTRYPASGTPVRLIGYGPNSWEKELNKSTPLTTGTNFTSQTSFCHKGTVEVRSKIDENLPNYIDRPTLQVGDSGGPLLIEGTSKVIGVASGHADSEESGYVSVCYASPALKENVEFLKSTIKSIGADIPGIDKL